MIKKVYDRLFVGDDDGVPEAKRRGMSRLCACKDGPDGHRALLGYTTLGAPQNSEYLFAQRGHVAAMNIIDNGDEDMIDPKMVEDGLNFAKSEYDAGRTLFIHCNHGQERGPSMALMFMRAMGWLKAPTIIGAKRWFKSLYPDYNGKREGIEKVMEDLWNELPTLFN